MTEVETLQTRVAELERVQALLARSITNLLNAASNPDPQTWRSAKAECSEALAAVKGGA